MGTLRRLRSLATAIAPQLAPAAMEEAEIATDEPVDVADLPPTLLSDSQVVSFINRGYVILPLTEFSAPFHAGVHEESERLYHMAGDKGGAALGNNIYPAISGLSEVMRGPTVRGAVTSVCGPNYSTSPHRFMHESTGQGDQGCERRRTVRARADVLTPRRRCPQSTRMARTAPPSTCARASR